MLGEFLDTGVSREVFLEAVKHQATSLAALACVLAEKGIITPEELSKARAKAGAVVDQIFAAERDKAKKELDEKYPGIGTFLALLGYPTKDVEGVVDPDDEKKEAG